MFTEQTLLDDITEKWGAYGAHADLTRWMIQRIHDLTEAGTKLAEEIITSECPHCPNYQACTCGRLDLVANWRTLII